jgi:hypothetical protein
VVLKLAAGVEGDPQEARELLFAVLSSSFDDIRRDRHRGPDYLTAQCYIMRPPNPGGDPVRM